ncbi:MAG: DUF1570 domain-containing protein [Candidatus Aminicenantes bacterium]|nr:DUF1570 domain-containing protein [Candidatus Aminicenantes bacterium]
MRSGIDTAIKRTILIWIALASFFITPIAGIDCASTSPSDPSTLQNHFPFKKGSRVLYTDHYVVEYDTMKETARAMVDQLEKLSELFLKTFSKDFDLQVPKERMKAYLFKAEEGFRRYVAFRAPHMVDFFGMYDRKIKCLILLDPHGSPGYHEAMKHLELLEIRLGEFRRHVEFHEQRLTGRAASQTIRGQRWLYDQKSKYEKAKKMKRRAESYLKKMAIEKFYMASLHEGVHQLRDMTDMFSVAPLWLEEGLAEYFANADYIRKGFISPGKTNKHALIRFKRAFSDGKLIPLDKILRWGVSTPTSHQLIENEQIPVAYSEFWALFYFFLHADKGKWRDSLIFYIKDLKKNPPSGENGEHHLLLFQKFLFSDIVAFEKFWIKTVLKWR